MARGKHQAPRDTGAEKRLILIVAVVAAVALAAAALTFVLRGMNKPPDDTGASPTEDLTDAVTPPENGQEDTPREDGQAGGSADAQPEDTRPDEPSADDTPAGEPPAEPVPQGPVNPLTGLAAQEDISENRPWAVMINNQSKAIPQAGIGAADVIVEAPVEGGITRLMALYQDMGDLQEIGPVRSARPYYINIAAGFDAMYIHAGGSDDAYVTMKSIGIDRIDGVNGSGETFHRDAWRRQNRGYEHSLMLDVPLLDGYAEKHAFRLTHNEDYAAPFAFDDTEERAGDAAGSVSVRFYGGSSKLTGFEYDKETKLYTVSQHGGTMTDATTGAAVKVRNIIIVKTAISVIPGDDAGRLTVELAGSGEGCHIADGVARDIKWSRASATSPWVFTLKDGTPLTLGTGTSYIILLPESGTVELK